MRIGVGDSCNAMNQTNGTYNLPGFGGKKRDGGRTDVKIHMITISTLAYM